MRRFALALIPAVLGGVVALRGAAFAPPSRPRVLTRRGGAVDEIRDALDSMLGVGLTEADLKNAAATERDFLEERLARRDDAVPSDALEKPSVAFFFAFVGLLPLGLFFAAVAADLVNPFNL